MNQTLRSLAFLRKTLRSASLGSCLLAAGLLAACASTSTTTTSFSSASAPQPSVPGVAVVPDEARDSRALAADLKARLDALDRQAEPASDDLLASLERTLREQRDKRARLAAAGSPSSAIAAQAAAPMAVKEARAARSAKASKAVRDTRKGRAVPPASAPAATAPGPAVAATQEAAAAPATVAASGRTPMARTSESRVPVEDLYVQARTLETEQRLTPAVALYREASQRGHAASSRRLMELYADGAPGVVRDYRVAVFFKERAMQQGVAFEPGRHH